jgi:hypothetical protein
LRVEDFAGPLEFSGAAARAAERFVFDHIEPGERVLFLHPETQEDKMWHPEGFAWVLEHFLDAHPQFIMKRADLYLGVDSCFLHAADLFRLTGCGSLRTDRFEKMGIQAVSPRTNRERQWAHEYFGPGDCAEGIVAECGELT